jgi:hypothetical protein
MLMSVETCIRVREIHLVVSGSYEDGRQKRNQKIMRMAGTDAIRKEIYCMHRV